ncbi:hypothetical protein BHE74_00057787, partial [Ensete ventricosum]
TDIKVAATVSALVGRSVLISLVPSIDEADVATVRGVDLTYARSAVRPLTPPYLCQIDFPRRVGHVGEPVVRGREDVTTKPTSVISFFPPGRPSRGAQLGANSVDLTERVNSCTNPGDLAEKANSDAPGLCISVDALEAGLRFPLHPLIEECLRWWRICPSQVAPNSWRYLIVFLGECQGAGIILTRDLFMACFRLCKSRGGYYLTTQVGFRVSVVPFNNKGWKSRYLFVSDSVWGFRLDWSAHPIGNASSYLSEEESVLVGRLKGILSSSRAIKEMIEIWLVEAGLSPASKGTVILPYFSFSSCLLTYKHKSRLGEEGSRSRSKGKEPAAPSEEPDMPVEPEEAGASPVHRRPRSMKDIFKTKIEKDDAGYYTLLMSDLGYQDPEKEMKARWKGLKNSTKVWNNSSAAEEFERGLLHPQLARELYTLPSEAVAKAEGRASELQEELEKTRRERDETLRRHEASEKELHKVRSNLDEAHRLLKEARVRARKMNDELLQSMKTLESARAELPRQTVVQYIESLGLQEGLKRMSQVTYEYGYQVALARFHARHPDAEVEEDPFTIHPEDDLVSMEWQQTFDDSVPPEP